MTAVRDFTAKTVLLDIDNIDTDQIIPARFLTTTTRQGLGKHAFNDWRYDEHGQARPDFVLNQPEQQGDLLLIGGDNFGCGSSREHAPWALLDAGVRAVVSTRIADIFRNNALKNGLLAIVLSAEQIAQLKAHVGETLRVDLVNNRIEGVDFVLPFSIDAFARDCLLEGVDELGYLLKREAKISAFEARAA